MAQARDLSYRFGGRRADVRGTSWAPPHLAFPLTLLCPELGLGKILCAKRRRRGGNGQVKKTGLWYPQRGQRPWKYRPSPPCPEDRIFAFEGHREDVNSIGNSTDRYGVPRLPSKEGAGRRPHFLLGTFCLLAGTESRGAGLGESRSVLYTHGAERRASPMGLSPP